MVGETYGTHSSLSVYDPWLSKQTASNFFLLYDHTLSASREILYFRDFLSNLIVPHNKFLAVPLEFSKFIIGIVQENKSQIFRELV